MDTPVRPGARVVTLPTEGLFLRRLLCGGFLAHGLGALAITNRFFGGRHGASLWEQRAGLSRCEAAVRVRLRALPIAGCPLALEFPLGQSAGRALLSRTFATPGLRIEGGTLLGWGRKGRKSSSNAATTTRLVIPEGVTSIAHWAFYGCSRLAAVAVPGSVASIGNYAFKGCSGLASISIPGSVGRIGSATFYGCSRLRAIAIPESVTSIGNYAFYDCSGLTAVAIPGSVASIGNYAFSHCSGLADVSLPAGATVGRGAFHACAALSRSRLAELQARYEADSEDSDDW